MELYNTSDKNKYEVNIPSGTGEYYSTCPACSHNRKPINQKKRCFSWNRTKEVGHCYHCGSSFVEFKESERLNNSTTKPIRLSTRHTPTHINNSTPQPINFIDQKYLIDSLGLDSNFGNFLISVFKFDEVKQILDDYLLGMTKDGSVIYWYIDKENRIRSGKIMQYDPITGKRIKNTSAPISWVHTLLKKQGKLDNDWEFSRCLFGEHLLEKYPQKDVMLLEGEKTAVICSMYFPENICLATGGSEMLSKSVCEALRARKVLVIADCDKVIEWKQKTMEINHSLRLNLKPYDKLNQLLTDEQKEMKWDLADYFLKGTI